MTQTDGSCHLQKQEKYSLQQKTRTEGPAEVLGLPALLGTSGVGWISSPAACCMGMALLPSPCSVTGRPALQPKHSKALCACQKATKRLAQSLGASRSTEQQQSHDRCTKGLTQASCTDSALCWGLLGNGFSQRSLQSKAGRLQPEGELIR